MIRPGAWEVFSQVKTRRTRNQRKRKEVEYLVGSFQQENQRKTALEEPSVQEAAMHKATVKQTAVSTMHWMTLLWTSVRNDVLTIRKNLRLRFPAGELCLTIS